MPPVTTIAELHQIEAEYFSFLTVRHPLERLLSAYRDKFFSLSEDKTERKKAAQFYKLYGRKIIRQYRVRTNNNSGMDPKYYQHWMIFIDKVESNDQYLCLPVH